MKNLLLFLAPLLAVVSIIACRKNNVSLVDVCHFDQQSYSWKVITVAVSELAEHHAHGDVILEDVDGDGFFPPNFCSYGPMGDCNDSNAAINPAAVEIIGNGIDENCSGMGDDIPDIGDDYLGGKLAYILQPGDPGYDPNTLHGLIAAPSDLSSSVWGPEVPPAVGGTGTGLGSGSANTSLIVAANGSAGTAAKLCADLELNGYSDWYLPSRDELNILFTNRVAIGGFVTDNPFILFNSYWSSSEIDHEFAWYINFGNGNVNDVCKCATWIKVRAVRSF